MPRHAARSAALNPLESEITVGRDRDNGLGVVGNSAVIIVRERAGEWTIRERTLSLSLSFCPSLFLAGRDGF